jgi:hypothetical protein
VDLIQILVAACGRQFRILPGVHVHVDMISHSVGNPAQNLLENTK